MKMEYELLVEMNKNLKIIDDSKKILSDKTLLLELKGIKSRFDSKKVDYNELKSQINSYGKICDDISGEIEIIEEELGKKEKVLLNDCGSDIHKINNTEMLIGKLQSQIDSKSQVLDLKLNEENELRKKAVKLSQELMALKETFFKNKQQMEESTKSSKENYDKANIDIKKLEKRIPEELLQVYFKIRKSKRNPIAFVKNDICMGCNLGLSAMRANEVKKSKDIVICDNCGRIIFPEK